MAQASSVVPVAARTWISVIPIATSPRTSASQTSGVQSAIAWALSASRSSAFAFASAACAVAAATAVEESPTRWSFSMMGSSCTFFGTQAAKAARASNRNVRFIVLSRMRVPPVRDPVWSPIARSEPERLPLDVLLDLMLTGPHDGVRLQVNQPRIDLVEDDRFLAFYSQPYGFLLVLDR